MANWRFKLTAGKALREAIENEDRDAVLDNLILCWRAIRELMPDDYEEYELEDDIEAIGAVREDMDYEDEDYVEEEIDGLLRDFYDFCDGYRIWVDF